MTRGSCVKSRSVEDFLFSSKRKAEFSATTLWWSFFHVLFCAEFLIISQKNSRELLIRDRFCWLLWRIRHEEVCEWILQNETSAWVQIFYDTFYVIRFVVYDYVLSFSLSRRSHVLEHFLFQSFSGFFGQILKTQLLVISWRIIRGSFEMLFLHDIIIRLCSRTFAFTSISRNIHESLQQILSSDDLGSSHLIDCKQLVFLRVVLAESDVFLRFFVGDVSFLRFGVSGWMAPEIRYFSSSLVGLGSLLKLAMCIPKHS